VDENAAKPLFDTQGFQQPLLFGNRKLDVTGHEIGETAWIGDGIENLMNDFLGKSAALTELSGALARLFL
jgi:hypothetical protein